ncbi:MAG: hypothetical protein H0X17_00160 [Deltaproteobacteria bacterium]|nr:hypothetical protein [Deltaproteobacteria bacterium]
MPTRLPSLPPSNDPAWARPSPAEDADVAEDAKAPAGPWQEFEELGLGKPKRTGGALAGLVVSMYRLLGFGILTMIVVVLVGYIVQTAFFYVNTTWIAPIAISTTDERVVAARAQLAVQQDQRERTAAELAQSALAIGVHEQFQADFARAIRGDRQDRKLALAQVKSLAARAARARADIGTTTDAYASATSQRMAQELEAGLIDRNTMLSGKYQLAQIDGAKFTMSERQAQYEARAAELASQTRALDAIVAGGKRGPAALSYDVLRIKREYDASRLELAKAVADRKLLEASLVRQDQTIADLQRSNYLRAVAGGSTVALIPYDNLDGVTPGAEVTACTVAFVYCRRVGTVAEILRGEVSFKHPRRDRTVRGQMIELALTDPDAAKRDLLFVGGAPLGL